MLKAEEAANPQSCWNKARDDERVFVLLARDAAAPAAIRAWVAERIRLGKNRPGDPQITEAMECVDSMEQEAHPPVNPESLPQHYRCRRCQTTGHRDDWITRYGIIKCSNCLQAGYVGLLDPVEGDAP